MAPSTCIHRRVGICICIGVGVGIDNPVGVGLFDLPFWDSPLALWSSMARIADTLEQLGQRRLHEARLLGRPPRRIVAEIVEAAGQIAGQHREVDRDRCRTAVHDRTHRRTRLSIDHPQSFLVAGGVPPSVTHDLERRERGGSGLVPRHHQMVNSSRPRPSTANPPAVRNTRSDASLSVSSSPSAAAVRVACTQHRVILATARDRPGFSGPFWVATSRDRHRHPASWSGWIGSTGCFTIAVLALLVWVGFRMEPHRVSERRSIHAVQRSEMLSPQGDPLSKWLRNLGHRREGRPAPGRSEADDAPQVQDRWTLSRRITRTAQATCPVPVEEPTTTTASRS